MSVPTVVMFFAEVRGYSKLYNSASDTKLGMSFQSLFSTLAAMNFDIKNVM